MTNPTPRNHAELSAQLISAYDNSDLDWGEEAAIRLLIAQGSWLRKPEFTRHVSTETRYDGVLFAWVDWEAVASEPDRSPASDGERSILRLACHLAGHLPTKVNDFWSIADMLRGLDSTNALLASRAIAMTALGSLAVGPLQ